MAYTRTQWVEQETPLSAQNMNNIEDGIEELQSTKVDKATGKGLSDQNYTAAEKTKLAGIETGAQVNPGVATTSANGLMSAADKTKLDGVQAGAQVNPSNATESAAGLMSAADKTKLNGITAGAEVNQNAFGVVDIESGSATAIYATSKQDGITFKAGSNVSMLASGKNVTISAVDTTYAPATTSAPGLMSAADKTKLNSVGIWGARATLGSSVSIGARNTRKLSLSINAGGTLFDYAVLLRLELPEGLAINSIGFTSSSLVLSVVNTTTSSVLISSGLEASVLLINEVEA